MIKINKIISIVLIAGSLLQADDQQQKDKHNIVNNILPGYATYVISKIKQANQVPAVFIQSLRFTNGVDYPNSTYSLQDSLQPLYVNTTSPKKFMDINNIVEFNNLYAYMTPSGYNGTNVVRYGPAQHNYALKTAIKPMISNNFTAQSAQTLYEVIIRPGKSRRIYGKTIDDLRIVPEDYQGSSNTKQPCFNPYCGDNQVMPTLCFNRSKGQDDNHYITLIKAQFPNAYGNPATDYSSLNSSIVINEKALFSDDNLMKLTGLSTLFYYTLHMCYDLTNCAVSLDAISFVGWQKGKENINGKFMASMYPGNYLSVDITTLQPKSTIAVVKKTIKELKSIYTLSDGTNKLPLISTFQGLYP